MSVLEFFLIDIMINITTKVKKNLYVPVKIISYSPKYVYCIRETQIAHRRRS